MPAPAFAAGAAGLFAPARAGVFRALIAPSFVAPPALTSTTMLPVILPLSWAWWASTIRSRGNRAPI